MTSHSLKLTQSDNLVPRLSPITPFVVGRKTLVAAGHVTTQNLGGKKICLAGGVAECFDCCCDKLCGFQNFKQSLKNYPLYRGSKLNFTDAVSKILPNGARNFRQ